MINKKNIIIFSVIFVLIFIASIIYYLIPRSYITFQTAPNQVNVLIDNDKKAIKNGDNIIVQPGHHKITVSQKEFSSYTKEIDVKNGKTVIFLVALSPLTDAAKKLIQDSKSQSVIEAFYSAIQEQESAEISKNYPILAILPLYARLYRIYACLSQEYPNDKTKVAICVDGTSSDLKPYVLKDITSRGYNPSDYEIIWNFDTN